MLLDMGLCTYLFAWFFSFSLGDNEMITRQRSRNHLLAKSRSQSLSGLTFAAENALLDPCPTRLGQKCSIPWFGQHFWDHQWSCCLSGVKCFLAFVAFFFFGGGGCLTWYKYVKAICWMVWVAQIAQELMESKNRGEHTESREVGPKLSWAACSGAAFPKRTPFTPQHFKELTVGQFTIICAVSHWIEWFWLYLYDMCVHETFVK